VSDTGKGMPQEIAQTLFTSSSTVSTEGTSSEKGTGLGLALCYDYLKHMGGEISVQSEENKGTTFTIWIPFVSKINWRLLLNFAHSSGQDQFPLRLYLRK